MDVSSPPDQLRHGPPPAVLGSNVQGALAVLVAGLEACAGVEEEGEAPRVALESCDVKGRALALRWRQQGESWGAVCTIVRPGCSVSYYQNAPPAPAGGEEAGSCAGPLPGVRGGSSGTCMRASVGAPHSNSTRTHCDRPMYALRQRKRSKSSRTSSRWCWRVVKNQGWMLFAARTPFSCWETHRAAQGTRAHPPDVQRRRADEVARAPVRSAVDELLNHLQAAVARGPV